MILLPLIWHVPVSSFPLQSFPFFSVFFSSFILGFLTSGILHDRRIFSFFSISFLKFVYFLSVKLAVSVYFHFFVGFFLHSTRQRDNIQKLKGFLLVLFLGWILLFGVLSYVFPSPFFLELLSGYTEILKGGERRRILASL